MVKPTGASERSLLAARAYHLSRAMFFAMGSAAVCRAGAVLIRRLTPAPHRSALVVPTNLMSALGGAVVWATLAGLLLALFHFLKWRYAGRALEWHDRRVALGSVRSVGTD